MKHKLQRIKDETQQLTAEISSYLRRSAKDLQKVADDYDICDHCPNMCRCATMEVLQMKFNYNKTRATINDKYQTAKWNARQSVQRTKDRIRAEVVKPRKPIKLPF